MPREMSRTVFGALIVSVGVGTGIYFVAGNSVDLFLGGTSFACLIAPPLAAIAGRMPGVVARCSAIALGFGITWMVPVWQQAISLSQWCRCVAVLWTLLMLLSTAGVSLRRLGIDASLNCGIVSLAAIAWLISPVWMSGMLPGGQLNWSVAFHPIFAINGIMPDLGIWTEQPVAYGLTSIGQDVQYHLPVSIWPILAGQLGLASVLFIASRLLRGTPTIKASSSAACESSRSRGAS